MHSGLSLLGHTETEEGNVPKYLCLPFLDVLLKIDNGTIATDIYHKATDTHNYLPFTSSHPRATRVDIPYNLARRIHMIVSDKTTRDERYSELSINLQRKDTQLK